MAVPVGLVNSSWRRWLCRIRSTLEFDYEIGARPRVGGGVGTPVGSIRFPLLTVAQAPGSEFPAEARFESVVEPVELGGALVRSKVWGAESPESRGFLV